MLKQLKEWGIKNIIWDVDGVLANENLCVYCFIKNHPKFKEHFKNYKYEDLDKALPVETEKYGAIELRCHPTLGFELNKEFVDSEYFFDRPLYYGTDKVLRALDKMGYKQFVLSATGDYEKKTKLLNQILGKFDFLNINVVMHDEQENALGNTKEQRIKDLLEKYNLKASETVMVDDRIYNLRASLSAGIRAIRFRSEFTTPNPKDFDGIVPEVEDIREFLID